jgi:hypothetical protein
VDPNVKALLLKLDAALDADPDGFIEASLEPTADDLAFIGHFIQLYCFADYCARRIIDAIREAAIGPEARNASKLFEKDVFPSLEKAAHRLWDGKVKTNLLKAAGTIGMHRQHRHTFAHWAVRRVPEEDVLLLLSKDAREGKRRDGHERDSYQSSFGFVALPPMRTEVEKLNAHTHILSVYAYELETRIEEVREGIRTGRAL